MPSCFTTKCHSFALFFLRYLLTEEDGRELSKPEFEGLWDQHKPYKVPKDIDDKVKLPGASKMEKVCNYLLHNVPITVFWNTSILWNTKVGNEFQVNIAWY